MHNSSSTVVCVSNIMIYVVFKLFLKTFSSQQRKLETSLFSLLLPPFPGCLEAGELSSAPSGTPPGQEGRAPSLSLSSSIAQLIRATTHGAKGPGQRGCAACPASQYVGLQPLSPTSGKHRGRAAQPGTARGDQAASLRSFEPLSCQAGLGNWCARGSPRSCLATGGRCHSGWVCLDMLLCFPPCTGCHKC